ncbi:DNA-binding CsgD family transcriptional regulator [Microbacterium resistens]|uniref:DNA-binding CsgD family transcriptional regulator n=1 Tax=Microbacterium resistens TaxID=156977 RepID=A0ABU1S923_9MICO|nr:LuxR C-terminal-related transcriptional regulator [Microbacterium resistens]MDR6866094.1 DNA-binding CsgD family transcriptional regulator [Microbacterium resistens]
MEELEVALRTFAMTTEHRTDPVVAARLTRFARHDAAAAHDVAASLSGAQLAGMAMLPDPLPVPASIREILAPVVDALAPASRRLLITAAHAVLDRVDILLTAAAVDISTVLRDEVADVLILEDGRFRFADERLRAILVHGLDAAQGREVHRSLARAAAECSDPRAAAWHALVGEAKNAPVAGALLGLADRLLVCGDLRGAYTVAGRIAEQTTGDAHAAALLIAGRAAFASGCLDEADELLEQASVHGGAVQGPLAATLRKSVQRLNAAEGSAESSMRSMTYVQAVKAAAVGMSDAWTMDAASRVPELWDRDPVEADAVQAGVYLASIRSRPEWPWRLSPGPLSPLIEAFVHGQHIATQARRGDDEGAASTLRAGIGRLPLAQAVRGAAAEAIIGLIRRMDIGRDDSIGTLPGAVLSARPLLHLEVPRVAPWSSIAARWEGATDAADPASPQGAPEPRLSARQRQILELLLDGRKNREVGALLGISPRTVEVHISGLLRKLGVRNRVELVSRTLRRASAPGRI